MNLGNVMLSERSHHGGHRVYSVYRKCLEQANPQRQNADLRLPGPRMWGEGEGGNRVFLQEEEIVPELDRSDGHTRCE